MELRAGREVQDPYPVHWHEEYQLCLVEGGGGWLDYRRERHATPLATLFVVHPGEPHANQAPDHVGCSFRSMYLPAEFFARANAELRGSGGVPFFSTTVIDDGATVATYRRLHRGLWRGDLPLRVEGLLCDFAELLLDRAAEPHARAAPLRTGVDRVKELLTDRAADSLPLEELAAEAGLSKFHLHRLFREQVGMAPHAFQVQARVARAKRLLREGAPVAEAAHSSGFADQAHLTRWFRRLVLLTPAEYQRQSKNVQDPCDGPDLG